MPAVVAGGIRFKPPLLLRLPYASNPPLPTVELPAVELPAASLAPEDADALPAEGLPAEELRPLEKSGKPDDDALAEPELPLAPPLLACEPGLWEPGLWEPGLWEPEDCELDELRDGIEDEDDEDDDEGDDDGMDDELLLDEDDGICGMLLDDCCDCCVDSHALSNSAETLRHSSIRVRGMFMITDSNRKSQYVEFTVIKTGLWQHYCASDPVLSIS